MEENTLLIKKITFKYVFCFTYSKTFFLLTQQNIFFRTKIVFQNLISKHFFFLKTQKIVLKNYYQKLFFRTIFKNNNQICPKSCLVIIFYLKIIFYNSF